MTLGWKLFIVLLAFVAILGGVIFTAFRERRKGRHIAADDTAAQQASDARILAVIFSAILGGMMLTLLVGWLIFL